MSSSMSPPPPPPYGEPAVPEPGPVRSWRRELACAAVVIVLLELVAVPLGLLWGHVAPHPLYSVGGHQLNLAEDSAKPLVRADFWFLVITGAAGVVAGVLAFFAARYREIGATLGLAIGGLAAGWLAWRVGHAWTGGTQPLALALKPDNTKVHLAADLGARAVLVAMAVGGVAAHAVMYAVTWPAKAKPDPDPVPVVGDGAWPVAAGPPVTEA